MACTSAFAEAVGWDGGGGRFTDHEAAKKEGFPGALVPGIMAMGFLTSMIHRWSPAAEVVHVDTVFRAPLVADQPCLISAVKNQLDKSAVDEILAKMDLGPTARAEQLDVERIMELCEAFRQILPDEVTPADG